MRKNIYKAYLIANIFNLHAHVFYTKVSSYNELVIILCLRRKSKKIKVKKIRKKSGLSEDATPAITRSIKNKNSIHSLLT
jgi:hypothetical protein